MIICIVVILFSFKHTLFFLIYQNLYLCYTFRYPFLLVFSHFAIKPSKGSKDSTYWGILASKFLSHFAMILGAKGFSFFTQTTNFFFQISESQSECLSYSLE